MEKGEMGKVESGRPWPRFPSLLRLGHWTLAVTVTCCTANDTSFRTRGSCSPTILEFSSCGDHCAVDITLKLKKKINNISVPKNVYPLVFHAYPIGDTAFYSRKKSNQVNGICNRLLSPSQPKRPFFFLFSPSHCFIPITFIHQVQYTHPHSHAVQQIDFERDVYHKCIMVVCVWLCVLYVLYLKLRE